jgi:transporter family protein
MAWFAPTLAYIAAVGALGVTAKLALRTLSWPDIVLWTGVGYIAVAAVLLAVGRTELRVVHDTPWAMLSGALAITGLVMLSVALGRGQASTVTAVSAGYPAVTLVLAAAFLAEGVSVARAAGVGLVICGVVVLTLAR